MSAVNSLRTELSDAAGDRAGWSREDCNSWSVHRVLIHRFCGREYSGDVIGNPNGWWWAVWLHGNPVRGMRGTGPEASAQDAVTAVEAFIANCRGSGRTPAEGGEAARVAPPKNAVDLVEPEGGETP